MVARRRNVALLLLATTIPAAGECRAETDGPKGSDGSVIHLPKPKTDGGMSLIEALAARRSVREFQDQPLTLDHVSQLCWAAQGITDRPHGFRAAPSAGAMFPTTVFAVDRTAVYQYEPERHLLRRIVTGDARQACQRAALDQGSIGAAPLCMAIAFDVSCTERKYGDRAERYCLLEAGHVAQNILLQATALRLGGVSIGAFEDVKVAAVLKLPSRLKLAYLIPVGHPFGGR